MNWVHKGISNTIFYYINMIVEIPIHANANMLPSLTFDLRLDYPPCVYQHIPLQNKYMYISPSMSSGLIVILIRSMF